MVTGIGIDLIEIDRVESALRRRPGLERRLFTGSEIEYSRDQGRPGRHLAARFAAKEAAVKALALEEGAVMREFEVVSGAPPRLRLHGSAARAAAGRRLHLSITHTDLHASAVVVVESDRG